MTKRHHNPSTKYHSDSTTEFQPGSRGRVLKNYLGITSVRKMEETELQAYMAAERAFVDIFGPDHKFTKEEVNIINHIFLGQIYSWAGMYRDVNLSKGNFPFVFARAIPNAIEEFEKNVLRPNTPCHGTTLREIAEKIAHVHTELLLIHPYREGNGRTARLLATLMAYQANMPGIDFGFLRSRGKEFNNYVRAIQAGVDKNYKPMTQIVLRALKRALRRGRG